jgi:hypothetical protein
MGTRWPVGMTRTIHGLSATKVAAAKKPGDIDRPLSCAITHLCGMGRRDG